MKPGLDILNTGHGHAEIHFDNNDPIELEWPVSIKADNEADAIKLAELMTNLEHSLVAAGHMPSPTHHE